MACRERPLGADYGTEASHRAAAVRKDEGLGLGLVMSLNAGADSQATLRDQIRFAHQCAFWDSVTPAPRSH